MTKKISLRIILDILLFAAILNGWWFVALPISLIGLWYFPLFIEIIIAGVAYDALFGMSPGMGLKGFIGTIISVVIFCAVFASKRFFRK